MKFKCTWSSYLQSPISYTSLIEPRGWDITQTRQTCMVWEQKERMKQHCRSTDGLTFLNIQNVLNSFFKDSLFLRLPFKWRLLFRHPEFSNGLCKSFIMINFFMLLPFLHYSALTASSVKTKRYTLTCLVQIHSLPWLLFQLWHGENRFVLKPKKIITLIC